MNLFYYLCIVLTARSDEEAKTKATELIKNSDMSISEIAFSVGFRDSNYYSKCFRKKYNLTPREYISQWRKGE